MGLLEVAVVADESGPVVRLTGEVDTTTVAQLSDVLTAVLSGGARHVTIDLSGLRFADSASIRAMVEAHRTLAGRGGALELAYPSKTVAKALTLLGVDQVLTVRQQPDQGPE